MVEKQTYSIKEYAVMLGVSPQTVVAWMRKGIVPGEKPEGAGIWVIRKPEVDEWFSRQRLAQDKEQAA